MELIATALLVCTLFVRFAELIKELLHVAYRYTRL